MIPARGSQRRISKKETPSGDLHQAGFFVPSPIMHRPLRRISSLWRMDAEIGTDRFLDFQIVRRCRTAAGALERARLLSTILKNFRSLEGNKTARHHAIEHRRETVDLFLRVDDLNYDRQILRKAQSLAGMNAARMAESDVAAQDGCTAEVHLPRL
jgi:hypothetical protein